MKNTNELAGRLIGLANYIERNKDMWADPVLADAQQDLCREASAYIVSLEKMARQGVQVLSTLLNLEQAYSNRHSPQHRAAAITEAKGVIAKMIGEY